MSFETLLEQAEAKHLLGAALARRPGARLPLPRPGRRRQAARGASRSPASCSASRERVERRAHPDLYVLEPLGDQIRIDDVRELRRDLHMRPFEADRRVYLIFGAHLLNAEAADALLKDLEEPPPYAVVVLVADELGPLPETIRSRCQLVPFRRLSERAIRAEVERLAPGLSPDEADGGRAGRGRPARPRRAAARPRGRPPARGAARGRPRRLRRSRLRPDRGRAGRARARGASAPPRRGPPPRRRSPGASLPDREAEQHVKRAERGAEREEILLALEELAAWYRDLVVVAAGAERAVVHYDRLAELAEDATAERMPAPSRPPRPFARRWRTFEEFNVSPPLALEALFVRLRRGARRHPHFGLAGGAERTHFGHVCLAGRRRQRRDPDDHVTPDRLFREPEDRRPGQRLGGGDEVERPVRVSSDLDLGRGARRICRDDHACDRARPPRVEKQADAGLPEAVVALGLPERRRCPRRRRAGRDRRSRARRPRGRTRRRRRA